MKNLKNIMIACFIASICAHATSLIAANPVQEESNVIQAELKQQLQKHFRTATDNTRIDALVTFEVDSTGKPIITQVKTDNEKNISDLEKVFQKVKLMRQYAGKIYTITIKYRLL